jgi:hypothetical protein
VSQSKSKTNDASIRARYAHHLRERPGRISEVLQQASRSTDVECAVWERKRSRFADLERDGQAAFLRAPAGLGDQGFARIQPNQPAGRTDTLNNVDRSYPAVAQVGDARCDLSGEGHNGFLGGQPRRPAIS